MLACCRVLNARDTNTSSSESDIFRLSPILRRPFFTHATNRCRSEGSVSVRYPLFLMCQTPMHSICFNRRPPIMPQIAPSYGLLDPETRESAPIPYAACLTQKDKCGSVEHLRANKCARGGAAHAWATCILNWHISRMHSLKNSLPRFSVVMWPRCLLLLQESAMIFSDR